MTDEYTPTTEEVRDRHGLGWSGPYRDELLRHFDRWLAAHDAEQQRIGAERGWDEGYSAGYADGDAGGKWADDENPYRKDAS